VRGVERRQATVREARWVRGFPPAVALVAAIVASLATTSLVKIVIWSFSAGVGATFFVFGMIYVYGKREPTETDR
jgi:hypothetical protein